MFSSYFASSVVSLFAFIPRSKMGENFPGKFRKRFMRCCGQSKVMLKLVLSDNIFIIEIEYRIGLYIRENNPF